MTTLKYIFNKPLNILKWFLVIILALVILLGMIEFIADIFFDNAAQKDSCADFGGAWDYSKDKCRYAPNDLRGRNDS